jgi:hypothetical protein
MPILFLVNFNDYAIEFIIETDWKNLPVKVQYQSKRFLLDLLGAMLAGMETPVAKSSPVSERRSIKVAKPQYW